MTIARRQQIDNALTSYYHITSRCVRQAYLCGYDKKSQKPFHHRKEWILARLALLAECFSINICAYAIMDNHYHLVLHIDHEVVDQWSDSEVMDRKNKIFGLTPLERLFIDNKQANYSSQEEVVSHISTWRQRLRSISWFMRCLNEYIAKKANREDECKGRFWESRFKSQAILDMESLQSCMAYVDLNPVRSGVCRALPDANYTSIQQRLEKHKPMREGCRPTLASFHNSSNKERHCIPFTFEDYVDYVRGVGSVPRSDKKSGSCFLKESISGSLKTTQVIQTFGKLLCRFESAYGWVIGTATNLRQLSAKMERQWIKGINLNSYPHTV